MRRCFAGLSSRPSGRTRPFPLMTSWMYIRPTPIILCGDSPDLQRVRREVQVELIRGLTDLGGLDEGSRSKLLAKVKGITAFYGRPMGNLTAYYEPLPRLSRRRESTRRILKIG